MNALLPYEEQLTLQFGDLVLPDENLAWADMKRRLDEDDDDRLIPVWLRGCVPAGLLIIALLGAGWWLVRPEKWFKKTNSGEKIIERSGDTTLKNSGNNIQLRDSIEFTNQKPQDPVHSTIVVKDTPIINNSSNKVEPQKTKPGIDRGNEQIRISVNRPNPNRPNTIKKVPGTDTSFHQPENSVDPQPPGLITKSPPAINPVRDTFMISPAVKIPDNTRPIDSVKKDIIDTNDSITKEDSLPVSNDPKKEKIRPPTFFSAGIALQQQLPVNGQKWTPYNSVGRKGTLADYIPSVYARVEKKQKWFLQGEFKYGAPQYNRPLIFYKRIDTTVVAQKFSTTSQQLEKTYYHHLGLGFSYYVLPNWSIGTGIGWNKFYRAVSTQDVVEHTIATGQDTLLSSGNIIRNSKPDSNFVNSWYQAMFETQYKWKRFSIGARYSIGLQPFIRFKLPGGAQQEEKNSSFQLFLRYELWKSKEK
jgi:hypothetical protein